MTTNSGPTTSIASGCTRLTLRCCGRSCGSYLVTTWKTVFRSCYKTSETSPHQDRWSRSIKHAQKYRLADAGSSAHSVRDTPLAGSSSAAWHEVTNLNDLARETRLRHVLATAADEQANFELIARTMPLGPKERAQLGRDISRASHASARSIIDLIGEDPAH